MTILKNLESHLREKHEKEEAKLWSPIREYNYARLHHTPDTFGQPMTEDGVMQKTEASVDKLADAMQMVIESSERIVDITSLDPPRGPKGEVNVFYDAIINGIRNRAKAGSFTVRMLFGKPPKSGRGEVHDEFMDNLKRDLAGVDVKVYFGVYSAISPSTGPIPIFNHAKIFASDTAHAVVGGHNLYDTDYRQYPPVHDVSVEVKGPAALDARNFASYLWSSGIANQTSWNPLSMASNRTSTYIKAWELVTRENTWNPITAVPLEGYENQFNDRQIASPGDDWYSCRILTVGRCGGWNHNTVGSYNASDYMKEFLIANARESIKMAHQDFVAMNLGKGLMTRFPHSTCRDLGNALYNNEDLKVYAVVTAPHGSGSMDVYYNVNNGPQSAADYIMYYARPTVGTGKLRGADDLARVELFNRLFVAPIHFTDAANEPTDTHYLWPNSTEVKKAGGSLAVDGFPKSVGQHMKTTIIDDSIFVVGSDNHYPHMLAEINYVMEGDFVDNAVMPEFWNKLWQYSGPHAVQQWNASTTIAGE
jgi:murine toxin